MSLETSRKLALFTALILLLLELLTMVPLSHADNGRIVDMYVLLAAGGLSL